MPLRATYTIPAHPRAIEAVCEGLSGLNMWLLTEAAGRMRELHGSFPSIYEAGVKYRPEPVGSEEFWSIHQLLDRGAGDCEDLSAARVAEYRMEGVLARVAVVLNNSGYHAIVELPDGSTEDPSLICLALERERATTKRKARRRR